MRNTVRIMMLVLIVLVALPLTSALAQDGGTSSLTAEVEGVYYQAAAAGSFAVVDGDTYTLTLEGVSDQFVWLVTMPTMQVFSIPVVNVADNWAFAGEEIQAEAVLETGNLNIHMMLSMPAYDAEAGTITYQAVVGDLVEIEETKDGPMLPESFEAANVSVKWTSELQSALIEARIARREEIRDPDDPACVAAQDRWNAYLASDASLLNEYRIAFHACYYDNNQAECQRADQIDAQRKALFTPVLPDLMLLNSPTCM